MTAKYQPNLTQQLEDTLTQEIMRGVFQPGEPFLSENEAAKRFSVSRITVRRAYANLEKIGVINRKQRYTTTVATQLTAATDPIQLVGALLPIDHMFSRVFLSRLNQVAALNNSLVVLAPPFSSGKEQNQAALDMVCRGIRNLIVWGCDHHIDMQMYRRLRLLGINLVFFDHVSPGEIADYISLDSKHAIQLLFQKAREDGCTQFIFLNTAGLDVETNNERCATLQMLCRQFKLPFKTGALPWDAMLKTGAPEECRAFFNSIDDPGSTAIFTPNDFMAQKIYQAVNHQGRYYSITTQNFDTAPSICNIIQPMREMAEGCYNMLCRQRREGKKWRATELRIQGTPDWTDNQNS